MPERDRPFARRNGIENKPSRAVGHRRAIQSGHAHLGTRQRCTEERVDDDTANAPGATLSRQQADRDRKRKQGGEGERSHETL